MSDALPPQSLAAGPGSPRMALGLAWFGSSLGSGVLGWLVDGLAGRLLLSTAVLGFIARAAVASNRNRRLTLGFSAHTSMVLAGVGVVTAALIAVTGGRDVAEAVAIGTVPFVGGLLTHRLSRRARRMAK